VADPPWAKNGSFLVFQRIAQDVAKFHASVAALSAAHNLPAELLAASFVGRHRSGCPLELLEELGDLGQTQSDIGPTNPLVLQHEHINDFEFQGPDPVGYYVARAAHVRKTYPRDQDPPGEAVTQTRRILRRGIAFGAPYSSSASAGSPEHQDAERGLLFACYQSSIEAQFEFVQASLADPDFPAPGAGVDPLLNETAAATTIPQADPDLVPVEPFVRMTGGAYFFAPSIPALEVLSGAPD
jgi:Dyp-type peroxidase family